MKTKSCDRKYHKRKKSFNNFLNFREVTISPHVVSTLQPLPSSLPYLPTHPPSPYLPTYLPTYLAMYLHVCELQTILPKGIFWLTDLKGLSVSFKVAFSVDIPLMKSCWSETITLSVRGIWHNLLYTAF